MDWAKEWLESSEKSDSILYNVKKKLKNTANLYGIKIWACKLIKIIKNNTWSNTQETNHPNTTWSDKIKQHMIIHTGERSFEYKLFNKGAIQNSYLKQTW